MLPRYVSTFISLSLMMTFLLISVTAGFGFKYTQRNNFSFEFKSIHSNRGLNMALNVPNNFLQY